MEPSPGGTTENAAEWRPLLFAEIIRVNPLRFVRRHGRNADVEVDHQVRQMVAVNSERLWDQSSPRTPSRRLKNYS